jgi:hypothetical protein
MKRKILSDYEGASLATIRFALTHSANLQMREIRKDVQDDFVGQFLDSLKVQVKSGD